jgi:DNA polymerase-3 subunit gamma/tau
VVENAQRSEETPREGDTPIPLTPHQALARSGDQAYQALYRRFRPQRFADVRGQEHVTRALGNAVRDGRVAHAFLFSGPRGTGKTSTARILAMALNCESPEAGEPDGTCPSCTSIRTGASMDVFELDAASNRKLDEMRDLLSRVALGTPGRWKVYIIDEVHQLTADAASALLKTLEEPPNSVVFVLATTDPQKVLPTILSRTQHFEFRLLDGEVLTDLLSDINRDAGLGLPNDVVKIAVEKGRGSARDAESALEQLAAAGGVDQAGTSLSELVGALSQRDVAQTLQAVARAISAGREPRRLANDLVEHLRNAFLAREAPSLLLLPPTASSELAEAARQMGMAFLVRAMEMVGQALTDMRDSVDPRVTLEVALMRLISPAWDASPAALLERVERLERTLGEKTTVQPGQVRAGPGPVARPAPPPAPPTSLPAANRIPGATPGPAPEATHPPAAAGAGQAKVALGAFLRPGTGASNPAGLPRSPNPLDAKLTQERGPELRGAQAPAHGVRAVEGSTGPDAGGNLPTRDELTKAWGDTILGTLPRAAQVYMASGRFVQVSNGAAVFALPDPGLVSRATGFLGDAESALAAYFGRPVPLRLMIDKGATAPRDTPSATPEAGPDEPYDMEDLSELADAPPAVPVEQRILQAFPGAVLDE